MLRPPVQALPVKTTVVNDENSSTIEVIATSGTGKGTHTRFCDDAESADKVLADISNKEIDDAKAASEVAEAKAEEAAEVLQDEGEEV